MLCIFPKSRWGYGGNICVIQSYKPRKRRKWKLKNSLKIIYQLPLILVYKSGPKISLTEKFKWWLLLVTFWPIWTELCKTNQRNVWTARKGPKLKNKPYIYVAISSIRCGTWFMIFVFNMQKNIRINHLK